MADTVTTQLANAIQGTLEAHLGEYLDGRKEVQNYWFDPEFEKYKGADYPVVAIYETGDTVMWETCRGRALDGTLQPGAICSEYGFDLQVYVKCAAHDEAKALCDGYRDCIKSCLVDNDTLGGLAAEVAVKAGEPSLPFTEGSYALRAGVVRVTVTAWQMQGATTLIA